MTVARKTQLTKATPTLYTHELANEIAFGCGLKSMRSICADETMPDRSTVARWMATASRFRRDDYACAGIAGLGFRDEILAIAERYGVRVDIRNSGWVAETRPRPLSHGAGPVRSIRWVDAIRCTEDEI